MKSFSQFIFILPIPTYPKKLPQPKILFQFVCLFVCVEAYIPSQHFFSHVWTEPTLPGFNQYCTSFFYFIPSRFFFSNQQGKTKRKFILQPSSLVVNMEKLGTKKNKTIKRHLLHHLVSTINHTRTLISDGLVGTLKYILSTS